MLATVISPGEFCQRHRKTYRSHTIHTYLFSWIGYVTLQGHKDRDTTIIYTFYDNDLDYTKDLVHDKNALDISIMSMKSLIMDETRVIWHQRLCNMYTKVMEITSKVLNGLPPFTSDNDLDFFYLCCIFKMRINSAVHFITGINAPKLKQLLILNCFFMM